MGDLAGEARKRAEEMRLIGTYAGSSVNLDALGDLLRALAGRVDEQERRIRQLEDFAKADAEIVTHVGAIAYAAEEWFHGRISDDDLRATIANVLSQNDDEEPPGVSLMESVPIDPAIQAKVSKILRERGFPEYQGKDDDSQKGGE